MTIADWRVEIDEVDNQVLRLLNQRAKLAALIGKLKTSTDQPLTDEARERGLIARLAQVNAGPFDDAAISAIFRQIIAETRRLEANVCANRRCKTERRRNAASRTHSPSAQGNSEPNK